MYIKKLALRQSLRFYKLKVYEAITAKCICLVCINTPNWFQCSTLINLSIIFKILYISQPKGHTMDHQGFSNYRVILQPVEWKTYNMLICFQLFLSCCWTLISLGVTGVGGTTFKVRLLFAIESNLNVAYINIKHNSGTMVNRLLIYYYKYLTDFEKPKSDKIYRLEKLTPLGGSRS